jgi:hypothetical protein
LHTVFYPLTFALSKTETMRNLTFYDDATKCNWVQVQKRTAKRLFEQGEELVFCPCNFVPFGVWNCGMLIEADRYKTEEISFESCVANFEYYNCGAEQGQYTTFYAKHRIQPIAQEQPLRRLDESWLYGKYSEAGYNIEITSLWACITGNGSYYYAQGDELTAFLAEVCDIWNNSELTQAQAVLQWVNTYL